jgi:hypothetical protein
MPQPPSLVATGLSLTRGAAAGILRVGTRTVERLHPLTDRAVANAAVAVERDRKAAVERRSATRAVERAAATRRG